MKVIAIAGAKGGVGKTATAVNLARLAADSGASTLLWDLDPQGAATHCYRTEARVSGGANRLFVGKRDLRFHVRQISENLDLMPSDPSLRVAESLLAARRAPERALRKLLRPLREAYDVVILDCAPGLGLVTEAILTASDLVLTPVVPAPLSVRSLDQLTDFVRERKLPVAVVAFLSMVDRNKVLHRQIIAEVADDERFVDVAVPLSSAVERMGREQLPAVEASPRNLAAAAYRSLWAEVAGRLGLPTAPPS